MEKPDGTEVLVPFVTRIVPTIDLENQRVVIDPPGGLIDPEQAEVVRGESDDADASDGSEGSDRSDGSDESVDPEESE